MKTNHTLRYLDDGSIELYEQEMPPPGPGEVQVEGGYCGICSWDIATAKYGKDAPVMAPPGHEGMATITVVGEGVTQYQPGQKIACGDKSAAPHAGAFSTCRNIKVEDVYPLPEVSFPDQEWLVEPVSCVVTGLDHSKIKVADKVIVLGCGFMGLLFLQGLKKSVATEIIALDISENRLAKAQELGISETHLLGTADQESLIKALYERSIDLVIDTTGVAQGFDTACQIVKINGLVNHFGWVKSTHSTVDLSQIHFKGIQICSTPPAAQIRDPFPPAIEAIKHGIFELEPLITDCVSLSEYPALMKRILAGDTNYIKGVVKLEV
ncbi:zinc-dependent alcohol dehydrogenase [Pelagicoccus mobilis]|uniref:Zinc-binding dehydrogenase n=1 Tax=Pelagicoccus mobilis TaxID=415221 RepID=A0A934RWK9_9BACT|nr:zinc-binding dehydrogenase [Pelagicoccus mobilis]MBK1879085.1 zinc-binding dehydrogenase [Pelagicoccus mobilis]